MTMGKNGENLGRRRDLTEWFVSMAFVLLAVLLVRTFLFDVNVVRGTSMSDTLSDGNIMVARKFALDHIERGDIVTAVGVVGDDVIVKRVVGLPGEHVRVDNNGVVYVDGEKLPDEYQKETPGLESEYGDVQLGDDEYYLMGDNRFGSYDSRFFGPVPREDIRDVAVLRVFPFATY